MNQSTYKYVGYHFNHVAIIQSLEPMEVATSDGLIQYIESLCDEQGHKVSFDVYRCEGIADLRNALTGLRMRAERHGQLPIIHFEMHGDEQSGLVLANGSEMPWGELAAYLRPINVASGFNLFIVCTACFGAHTFQPLELLAASPFYATLGPSHAVTPAEIYAGMYCFYRAALVELDAGTAYSRLQAMPLTQGFWFCISAESWYERLVTGFIEKHCTDEALTAMVNRNFRQQRAGDLKISKGRLRRGLIQRMRRILETDGFATFFAVESIPVNSSRFAAVKRRVDKAVHSLGISRQLRLNINRKRPAR